MSNQQRHRTTPTQVQYLESFFEHDDFPDAATRERIAEVLRMPIKICENVQRFQNRRAKRKQEERTRQERATYGFVEPSGGRISSSSNRSDQFNSSSIGIGRITNLWHTHLTLREPQVSSGQSLTDPNRTSIQRSPLTLKEGAVITNSTPCGSPILQRRISLQSQRSYQSYQPNSLLILPPLRTDTNQSDRKALAVGSTRLPPLKHVIPKGILKPPNNMMVDNEGVIQHSTFDKNAGKANSRASPQFLLSQPVSLLTNTKPTLTTHCVLKPFTQVPLTESYSVFPQNFRQAIPSPPITDSSNEALSEKGGNSEDEGPERRGHMMISNLLS
ncbi:hypothetical protein G9A89_016612 [Geosiphon pyriformis]|nr:hypothetical protein G9A89_016612 [Geosiphon pyriformis]